MTKWYKTPSKRLIARGGGGRFRKTTLGDIGMALCKTCNAIFTPDYSAARTSGGFVDPRIMNDLRETCPECKEGAK